MKTRIRLFSLVITLAGLIFGLSPRVLAEISESEYATNLKRSRQDFEKVVAERRKLVLEEEDAAERRRLKRIQEAEKFEIARQQYIATHKPYSMEEIEAADRQDEIRLQEESKSHEEERLQFIKRRERFEAISETIGPVDPYLELDIDFKTPPESRVSGAESTKHN